MDNPIVLYGTGLEGEKFYWKYGKECNIAYCIDKNSNRYFHGIPVFSFEEKKGDLQGKHVLISTSYDRELISKMLEEIGLLEYEGFSYCENFGRELAILYGNCHMDVLKKYLALNPAFSRKYFIKEYMVYRGQCPSSNDLKYSSLFITQDIRQGEFKSAEELIEEAEGVCITIPNLFGLNLFFPQQESNDPEIIELRDRIIRKHFGLDAIHPGGNTLFDEHKKNVIRFTGSSDLNIIKKYKNMPSHEVANQILNDNLYEKEELKKRFNERVAAFQKRENKCDIQIMDFILENYKKFQTFYDPAHPTERIVCEKGRRILDLLGIKAIENIQIERMID